MLRLLPEEIWRPESPWVLKFLHTGVQKKGIQLQRSTYLEFLKQRKKQYEVINMGIKLQKQLQF
jgi:hypothetical protein